MTLTDIAQTLLSHESTNAQCREALDMFAIRCSEITDIDPDPSYTAWAGDTFLLQGVAINPNAAAYCIKDYQRSVVFMRGVYAALIELKQRAKTTRKLKVLYAGCGPFATLIMPLLPLFEPDELGICLLDIHQASLDSVAKLLKAMGLDGYDINLVQADACEYQHPGLLDLIIVETMQKALEQEPQFAVTANLASQLEMNGIFVPEEISVSLCLAHLNDEMENYKKHGEIDNQLFVDQGKRYPLSKLIQLSAESAKTLKAGAQYCAQLESDVLPLATITIPEVPQLKTFQPLLLTQITVFGEHALGDYDSSITLPSRCIDLEPMNAGEVYRASYLLGNYPKIDWQRLDEERKQSCH